MRNDHSDSVVAMKWSVLQVVAGYDNGAGVESRQSDDYGYAD
jgi:hypothetical protein